MEDHYIGICHFSVLFENYKNFNKNSNYGKVGLNYKFNEKFNANVVVRKTFHSYIQDDRVLQKVH